MSENHRLRKPCRCGGEHGVIETKSGQDVVRCSTCGKWAYNAPKTETGRKVRSVSSVHEGITTKKRARILLRAGGRCEMCGRSAADGVTPTVGHIVSVATGMSIGLTDAEINDDENLISQCEECNLGVGDETFPLRLVANILKGRLYRKGQK